MTTQRDYLFEELNRWRNRKKEALGGPYANRIPGAKKPKQVLAAEAKLQRLTKIIRAWEAKANVQHKKAMKVIDDQFAKARKQILFEDPKVALKYIEKLK